MSATQPLLTTIDAPFQAMQVRKIAGARGVLRDARDNLILRKSACGAAGASTSLAILVALLATTTPAIGQVYKSIDSSGRVQFSDKPPPGAKPVDAAGDRVIRELQGRWSFANMTMDGVLRSDEKLAGATWTFRNTELVMEARNGEKQRFTVTMEPGSVPKAFRIAPVPPSSERGGWMIYEREGDRLRVAFMDNLDGRPAGFEPRRKQVVATLIAMPGGAGAQPATGRKQQDPCAILRDAGANELLGSSQTLTTPGTRDPGPSCRIEQATGFAVSLMLVQATTRAALDRERDKLSRNGRAVVQDEPAIGPAGFSAASGNNTVVMTLQGDTLVALSFDFPPGNYARLLPFARRVVANIGPGSR